MERQQRGSVREYISVFNQTACTTVQISEPEKFNTIRNVSVRQSIIDFTPKRRAQKSMNFD